VLGLLRWVRDLICRNVQLLMPRALYALNSSRKHALDHLIYFQTQHSGIK
jgi:hypothetical protein